VGTVTANTVINNTLGIILNVLPKKMRPHKISLCSLKQNLKINHYMLPSASFLSSGWFMRFWEGQRFSFANFSIVIVTSHSSCFYYTCFQVPTFHL